MISVQRNVLDAPHGAVKTPLKSLLDVEDFKILEPRSRVRYDSFLGLLAPPPAVVTMSHIVGDLSWGRLLLAGAS